MKDILTFLKSQSTTENFSSIKIGLVSPNKVLSRSFGEVRKSETINYRTYKVERDGLFCAKVFGPTKDHECLCGKYKRLKHRGVICEKCSVEVTLTKVRRSRMGHIELATPVVHVWFLKSLPSKISVLLNMTLNDVERILCFEQFVIIDPGISLFRYGQFLSIDDLLIAEEIFSGEFTVGTGSEMILELLDRLNLKDERFIIKEQLKCIRSDIKVKQLLRRLNLVELFLVSDNKPKWMMLVMLPVLPPGLRPLVPLDGGRFASSDLNDLYRRVINRNNRLKKLIELGAPNIIIKNEKRMLQEAVDSLLDNGRRGKAVTGPNKRPLKSLADIIKGKQGRFRQNLLGKRVDYSGRSVIVVGPKLSLNQCGLPKKLALELFKPFIFGELKRKGLTTTIKRSKKMVEEENSVVWDILADIIYQHPVLLNRAPTLHRLGIQAFEPILIEGKAIQLHPLVCAAFNADFDGDQMAVHVPLSIEAQIEARILMLATNNILSSANGEPAIVPSQDMILGIHYLSKEKKGNIEYNNFFNCENRLERLYENGFVGLHTPIKFKCENKFVKTTYGRIVLKSIVPNSINFDIINKVLTKGDISNLIKYCYRREGPKNTVKLITNLMVIGFKYATKSGISIGINDLTIPNEKKEIVNIAKNSVNDVESQYSSGLITKKERYNKIIDIWSKANERLTIALMNKLTKDDEDINNKFYNPIYIMAESGARGSMAQIRQLAGMRGLMAKPDGSIIETPIIANFREGLNILQYFISTHGARKGLADTALKTANSGYLTRRLVDVAQDVVIAGYDCLTKDGLIIDSIVEGGNIIEPLKNRILGRTIQQDVYENGKILIKIDTLLNEEHVDLIENLNLETITVRSVIKCNLKRGICAKCYGRDLATGRLVNVGEAVGIIAAQSIGEPGTQLTMRTFHIGGAASKASSISNIKSKTGGIVEFKNIKLIKHQESDNIISVSRAGIINIIDNNKKEKEQYKLPYGSIIKAFDNTKVKTGDIIAQWDPHNYPLITEIDGIVEYSNLMENLNMKREIDDITGLSNLVIVDLETDQLDISIKPCIKVINNKSTSNREKKSENYFLSTGTIVNVTDKQIVKKGDVIAKIPKETSKIKDITGGLPRVANIFEARKPKEPAVLARVSGTVKFGKDTKGKKRLIIIDENNNEHEMLVPKWKNINMFENEKIKKGDTVIDGQDDLHGILVLLGVGALAEHIKKEVQDVYRLQGVRINDKHIEIIVKQMLKKVIIRDPGDSDLLVDKKEDIDLVKKINKNLKAENRKEIKYEKSLLGITKASLVTESFISAASFQETTRILTDAAIRGKRDKLLGLKENVIVGKLIPAGTGFYRKLD